MKMATELKLKTCIVGGDWCEEVNIEKLVDHPPDPNDTFLDSDPAWHMERGWGFIMMIIIIIIVFHIWFCFGKPENRKKIWEKKRAAESPGHILAEIWSVEGQSG